MPELKVLPEFQEKIPPLTDEEFEQLRENILTDGEVYEPIVTWNNTIVDGHNRWRIIQENWDALKDKFRIKEMDFSDKWAAFEWMYRKQLGRRNLTEDQRAYMIGKMYEAHKNTKPFKGNQYTKGGGGQNDLHQNNATQLCNTAATIGAEFGITESTVKRAEKFSRGVDALKKVSSDAAEKVLRGQANVSRAKISRLPKMSTTEVEEIVGSIVDDKPVLWPEAKPERMSHGWTKADREERAKLEAIAADMYDRSTVPEYTVESLVDDIQLCAGEFVQQIKNTLKDRSTVLTDENKPVIANAINLYIIKEIEKVRDLLK